MNGLRVTFLILAGAAAAMGVYVGLWMIPASRWFNPISLTVVQVSPGEIPSVQVDRTIHYTFIGSYIVDVRDIETGALVCGAPGGHKYKGGLTGIYSMSLDHFAGGDYRCARLPVGVYTAEACWTVKYPIWGFLPPKTVCITSNPFRVTK